MGNISIKSVVFFKINSSSFLIKKKKCFVVLKEASNVKDKEILAYCCVKKSSECSVELVLKIRRSSLHFFKNNIYHSHGRFKCTTLYQQWTTSQINQRKIVQWLQRKICPIFFLMAYQTFICNQNFVFSLLKECFVAQ